MIHRKKCFVETTKIELKQQKILLKQQNICCFNYIFVGSVMHFFLCNRHEDKHYKIGNYGAQTSSVGARGL